MLELPAGEAAKALDVPPRTLNYWLTTGEIKGYQKLTGRWWVSIGELRRIIRERGQEGSRTEAHFNRYVKENVLPKYEGESRELSTDVLCLTESEGQAV